MDTDDIIPSIIGSGLIGLVVVVLLWVIGFVVSAFIMSLWIRLILVFMRRRLDSEYALMRGAGLQQPYRPISPPQPEAPRNW
jgi:hypothetical protein